MENMSIPVSASILDLGCGAGIIGLTAARMGAGAITMTDTNLLAIDTARHNADRLGIAATIIASDVFAQLDGQRFDLILSNPPFHRGKKVDLSVANRLIAEAPAHLTPGGSLVIVANAFLAYDKHLREGISRIEIIARTPQFHVIQGEL
ncbi:MAG: class I SAM-dependent methyltransferase [Thermomicrobiales bacterium]|nr:class I SAM-dependent methyltransferase [Thermomicrobiales bacterium]